MAIPNEVLKIGMWIFDLRKRKLQGMKKTA
jgi:hypothetical protein